MRRKFLLAKTTIKGNNTDVYYHLLEKTENGTFIASFPTQNSGEKDFINICIYLQERISDKSVPKLVNFTLTSIDKITFVYRNNFGFALFYPLRDQEMEAFYSCYWKIGSNVK